MSGAQPGLTCREWRPIPGAVRYEVSSDGRVRLGQMEKGRTPNNKGYLYVDIVWDDRPGGGRSVAVHRLVMIAFVGPRPDGMCTRHLNGVKTDNRVENLAYGTFSENNRDTVAHGHHKGANKTHCIRGHLLTGDNVIELSTRPGTRRCRECSLEQKRAWWNTNRGKPPRVRAKDATECLRGHDLTVPGAINKRNCCRACHAEDERARRARRREAKEAS